MLYGVGGVKGTMCHSSLSIVVLPHLSQQEQRHLSHVIYNCGINWTDRDGTDLGVTVYSAGDDLSGISRGMVDSATNETYKWAEEAARPEGGLHQQPSTAHTSLATLYNFLLSANN
jgi:hypothetical protein